MTSRPISVDSRSVRSKPDLQKFLRLLPVIACCAGVAWISLALVGYGLALNRYQSVKRSIPGDVVGGDVISRWSWGLGYFGDVCFKITTIPKTFCVPQHFLKSGAGGPGNIFWKLAPGTKVSLKSYSGYVIDLSADDGKGASINLVDYGIAGGLAEKELASSDSGAPYVLLGCALAIAGAVGGLRRRMGQKLKKA